MQTQHNFAAHHDFRPTGAPASTVATLVDAHPTGWRLGALVVAGC